MSIIWATRGKNWGFRFLRDGGLSADVLTTYEEAFAGAGNSLLEFHITAESVAIRFPDPLNRKDRAGRVIPHEFVLTGTDTDGIISLDQAKSLVWPKFADEYAEIWED